MLKHQVINNVYLNEFSKNLYERTIGEITQSKGFSISFFRESRRILSDLSSASVASRRFFVLSRNLDIGLHVVATGVPIVSQVFGAEVTPFVTKLWENSEEWLNRGTDVGRWNEVIGGGRRGGGVGERS